MKMSRTIFVFVSAALAIPTLAKEFDVSTQAFKSNQIGHAQRAISYSTGFETAEGYTVGDINTQNGWSVFSGDLNQVVSVINPATGAQHYRNQNEPQYSAGTLVGAFSPNLGASAIAPQMLSVDINISAAGGADYDVVPQAPSQSFLTARVKFNFGGNIFVLDDIGGGLTFIDTGVAWTPGVYKNLTIDVDPYANTIDYYYGGAALYSGVAGVFAGTAIEQVVLLSDNWQANDYGDFDNVVITPEPTSLLLTGVALLAFRRR